jgi:general secretion pathway protein L
MPSSAVVLRLPAHEISRQTITLPAAARHRLRQVLAFELNRLSPIDPQKVQFTYRIIPGNLRKDYLAIDLWIIRKSTVERAIAICRDLALRPWELQQAGTDDAIDARDLFPRYAVFPRAKRNDAIAAMLCGAALVLAAGIAITIHQRNEQALATLQRQAAQAKADADRIIKLRNELTQRLSRASFLGQQKAKPSASAILAEITRLLPDDIWIAQFELVGAEIRLRGYAPKAAALIALIEKSPLFEKPQFKAPIVRAPNGDSERFDLSFVVKAGAS